MNEANYRQGTLLGKFIFFSAVAVVVLHFSGLAVIPYIEPVEENMNSILLITASLSLFGMAFIMFSLIAMRKEMIWPPKILPIPFKTKVKPVSRAYVNISIVVWSILFISTIIFFLLMSYSVYGQPYS